ncbi:hypothetical protein [Spiroplasma sp. SV19]|uniref:hypothetical protein n=1 Tax=Spiroplasma sp. SV19 TaxID=2570468 RepID=UPI0024B64529|nr:hypothetical protein [Spiroplasma sp. SV19]
MNILLNSSGELSRDVLTASYEKPITVYKGNDGSAYLNKDEALSTFQNYQKIYNIEGDIRYNEYEARELYENSIKKKLEDNANSKTTCYIQGAICETEQEIKNWLRSSVKNGFEYQGQYFSDYNFSDFKTVMNNIDQYTVDKYVKEVVDPDKSSYWISHDKGDSNDGFFIGPKYVETAQQLPSVPKFNEVSSFTPSLFFIGAAMQPFSQLSSYLYEKQNKQYGWEQKDFKIFLDFLSNNNILSKNTNDNFKELVKTLKIPNQILADSTTGLNDISVPSFNDFHKLLVAMKRILTFVKVYASSVENTATILEKSFKEMIVEVLNNNKETMSVLLDYTNQDDNKGANVLLNNEISFDDVYNMFLNQAAFYEENNERRAILNIVENIQSAVDNIMNVIGAGASIAGGFKDLYGSNNSSDKAIQEGRKKLNGELKDSVNSNMDVVLDKLHIKPDTFKAPSSYAGVIPIANIITGVWELSKTLSFISLKTMEFKIDQNNSLYYVVPTFKIPILNIELTSAQPNSVVTKLTESPLNYMLPSDGSVKDKKLYEFNDHYYLSKENAKEDLIEQIYLHPERYVPNKKLLINIMAKDIPYILPSEISEANICGTTTDDQNCINQTDYDSKLSEEKNKFVDQMFGLYYEPNKKEFFLDGFGNYFETRQEALTSLAENVAKSNFDVSYSYKTRTGKEIITETKEEIIDFINKNEVIDQKQIINSDLIISSSYDSLSEHMGINFDVYEMNYYGDLKYFMSYEQAWNYLMNHINYQVLNFDATSNTFGFGKHEFFSENDFVAWVNANLEPVKASEVKGKVVN